MSQSCYGKSGVVRRHVNLLYIISQHSRNDLFKTLGFYRNTNHRHLYYKRETRQSPNQSCHLLSTRCVLPRQLLNPNSSSKSYLYTMFRQNHTRVFTTTLVVEVVSTTKTHFNGFNSTKCFQKHIYVCLPHSGISL